MQVRAATNAANRVDPGYVPRNDTPEKKFAEDSSSAEGSEPLADSSSSSWTYAGTNASVNTDPHLEPASALRAMTPAPKPAAAKSKPQPASVHPPAKTSKGMLSTPSIPSGAYVIQVAALLKQDDATTIAGNLQKKHFAAYVQPPQKDKYYRVQVGPYKDQKSADAAKKGLEGEGFKAFYVKH
jgi:cell division septation protein DedD